MGLTLAAMETINYDEMTCSTCKTGPKDSIRLARSCGESNMWRCNFRSNLLLWMEAHYATARLNFAVFISPPLNVFFREPLFAWLNRAMRRDKNRRFDHSIGVCLAPHADKPWEPKAPSIDWVLGAELDNRPKCWFSPNVSWRSGQFTILKSPRDSSGVPFAWETVCWIGN